MPEATGAQLMMMTTRSKAFPRLSVPALTLPPLSHRIFEIINTADVDLPTVSVAKHSFRVSQSQA